MNIFGIIITFSVLVAVPRFVAAVNIECLFSVEYVWPVVGNIYSCRVQNEFSITSPENALITSVNGTHESGMDNDDVVGFVIEYRTVNYFPQALENFFKNLQLIVIEGNTRLKQISQSDIRNFPNITVLGLYDNDIETLEEGLFHFNPKLQYINFNNNNIVHVHSEVFDNLNILSTLRLLENRCINAQAYFSVYEVQSLIQQVRFQCSGLAETTTTPVPEDRECPASCLSKIQGVEEKLEHFMLSTNIRLNRIEYVLFEDIRSLGTKLDRVPKKSDKN